MTVLRIPVEADGMTRVVRVQLTADRVVRAFIDLQDAAHTTSLQWVASAPVFRQMGHLLHQHRCGDRPFRRRRSQRMRGK